MTSRCKILLLSSSKVHGYGYLEYAKNEINSLLKKNQVTKITFIPYALPDHENYLNKVTPVLKSWGYTVEGIHHSASPKDVIRDAEAIFIGGGNTFRLLKQLYENDLIDIIRLRVLHDGIPYIGSSAGTNVATVNIATTNDMPVVYPPSFNALNLVPFNINPHYIDPEPNSKHMGETREQRIKDYHEETESRPVLGLREGSMLYIEGQKLTLKGLFPAKLFLRNQKATEYDVSSDLSFLLDK